MDIDGDHPDRQTDFIERCGFEFWGVQQPLAVFGRCGDKIIRMLRQPGLPFTHDPSMVERFQKVDHVSIPVGRRAGPVRCFPEGSVHGSQRADETCSANLSGKVQTSPCVVEHVHIARRQQTRFDPHPRLRLVGIQCVGPQNGQGGPEPVQVIQFSHDPGRQYRNPPQAAGAEDPRAVVELLTERGEPVLNVGFPNQEFPQRFFRLRSATAAGLSRRASMGPPNEVFGISPSFEFHRSTVAVTRIPARIPVQIESIPDIHGVPEAFMT